MFHYFFSIYVYVRFNYKIGILITDRISGVMRCNEKFIVTFFFNLDLFYYAWNHK